MSFWLYCYLNKMNKLEPELINIIICTNSKLIEKNKLNNIKYFHDKIVDKYNSININISLNKSCFDIFMDYLETKILSISEIDNINFLLDLAIALSHINCFDEQMDIKFYLKTVDIIITHKSVLLWGDLMPSYYIYAKYIKKFYFCKFIILYDFIIHLSRYIQCYKYNLLNDKLSNEFIDQIIGLKNYLSDTKNLYAKYLYKEFNLIINSIQIINCDGILKAKTLNEFQNILTEFIKTNNITYQLSKIIINDNTDSIEMKNSIYTKAENNEYINTRLSFVSILECVIVSAYILKNYNGPFVDTINNLYTI